MREKLELKNAHLKSSIGFHAHVSLNASVSVNSYVFIENVQWIVQSEGSSIAVTVCPVIS
jgi:hypothetical protein